MILKALADYYDRMLADDPRWTLRHPDFERKAIPFLIVINPHGRFVNILDTADW